MNEQQKENPVVRYLKEVRSEMSKVIWPSREEALNLTWMVLIVMVAMGVFLGLADYIFSGLVQFLISALG
ncbi:MAG: preprotein translocase subunit SecE [Ardenticatenaceae bacterium]